jgi:DNA adenine methylase
MNNFDVDVKNNIRPVLKWVGGKRELLPELRKIYSHLEFRNYYEIFFGGGSVYFDIVENFRNNFSGKSIINDVNSDLINLYRHIKTNPNEVLKFCNELESDYLKYGYYHIRDRFNGIDRDGVKVERYEGVKRTSSLIVLNRTCFNGLFRTNKKGLFNVPEGRYSNPKIVDKDNLFNVSNILPSSEFILNFKFNEVDKIGTNDFVYMDPPYHPLNVTSSFTDYSGDFGTKEQIELRDYFKMLDEKGVFVLQSNSSSDFIKEIYSEFVIKEVDCKRNINSKGDKRGKIKEFLIIGNTLNKKLNCEKSSIL